MRYLTAFIMGGAFVFAIFILFPWMKSHLEFQPQFRIQGGSGELASDGGASDNGATSKKSQTKSLQSITQEDLDAEIEIAAARSRALLEKERALLATSNTIASERSSIDSLKEQIEAQLIEKLSDRAISDGSQKSKRRMQAIVKATPEERRRLMFEAYQQMTPEGLAEVIQDLAREQRTESAVSVLSILEDRKAARVLALVAQPQPNLAATLTEQLRDGGVRIR